MTRVKSVAAGLCLAITVSLAATGCTSDPQPYTDPRSVVAPEEVPETKRIRRLTADQFFGWPAPAL